MKIRKLYVYEDSTNKPYILLKGKWLQKLGFNFHNFVEVETYKDKIIIRKVKDPKKWFFESLIFYICLSIIEHPT